MSCLVLKILACFFMLIDHLGIFFDIFLFRIIGRISFPIFAFLIVNGFRHTKNVNRYLLRLLLFAFISEFAFDLYFFEYVNFNYQNVFFTLFFGLLLVFILHNFNYAKRVIYCLLLLILVGFFRCDYGISGVLLVASFYLFSPVSLVCVLSLSLFLYSSFGLFGLFGLFSLLFIRFYDSGLGYNRKFSFLFYWFYPVHLLLLHFLKFL